MAAPKHIVVADDDPTMRSALGAALLSAGYRVSLCTDGDQAEQQLKQSDADLVISDVRMPGLDGLELLRRFRAVPFIIISGFATVPEAVEAMKNGAFDFVVKPFSYRELMPVVKAALARGASDELPNGDEGKFITAHPRMLALLEFVRQVARSHASILIHGESGTGKELLARYIHAHSRRRAAPFIAVNCAALPEGLLESELFGHERGAFTGAVSSKAGKFELAHGGTLLLDEISEMPLALQAKLLRVLQEREVDRVGGKRPLPIDIRVISTTNRELREMIRAGGFREDLFYRLNVVPVRLFPLRERSEDIEMLARAFFRSHGYAGAALSLPALRQLQENSWRGNVRELFNVLERAAIMAGGAPIEVEHLLLDDELSPSTSMPASPGLGTTAAESDSNEGHARPARNALSAGSVRAMEEQLIFDTLKQTNDNRTAAAKLLGISVRTLRNKLKYYRERDCQPVACPAA
jgi:two-component system response regulator FlrC